MVEKAAVLTLKRIKDIQWRKTFNMMYMEPVVFLLVFAHALSGTIMRNQIIYQACTTVFNYNETLCAMLGTKNASDLANSIETSVQPYVANLFMIRTLLESIVPAVAGVFVGSWSDHYGRKPLLLISMIGFSCTYLIAAVINEVAHYYPVNPWYYILTAVPHSFLGGNCVFAVAAFCFISDVTHVKARPIRMIAMETFLFVGLTTGSILSSFIYEATNATIIFLISAVLMCSATAFIALYVPESLHIKHDEDDPGATVIACTDLGLPEKVVGAANGDTLAENAAKDSPTANTEKAESDPKKSDTVPEAEKTAPEEKAEKKEAEASTAGIFSYLHIKDMFQCVMRERPFYDRAIIWLVTGTMFLSIFVMDGAMTVFYLFVREKFHWTIREFTVFETISHLVICLGAILGVVILHKICKISIVTLAFIAFVSDVASSIVRGLASESWHLYLSVGIGLFKSAGGAMCRTIVSNIVPATELGKIFSIKNVLQSIAPFLASPLYTFIYNHSLSTFPGLFNLVSAGFFGVGCVFLAVVMRHRLAAKEHYAKTLK